VYTILNLVSLFSIALGICYGVCYGIMFAKGNGAETRLVVFALLVFVVALVCRALSDIGTRLTNLEKLTRKGQE